MSKSAAAAFGGGVHHCLLPKQMFEPLSNSYPNPNLHSINSYQILIPNPKSLGQKALGQEVHRMCAGRLMSTPIMHPITHDFLRDETSNICSFTLY